MPDASKNGKCHLSQLHEALDKSSPSTRKTLALRARKGAAKALEGTRYQVTYDEADLEKIESESSK